MRSIEEVEVRREKFQSLQTEGYDRYQNTGELGDYFRGWDDGVLAFVSWLLEERD